MDPQADLDALVNFLLPFARGMLGEDGDFLPFAGEVPVEGEVATVTLDLEDGEEPIPEDVIEALGEMLRVHAADGEIRASGICSDTTLEAPEVGHTDAVRVKLEHIAAEPVDVYVPYVSGASGYVFGDPVAIPGERTIFAGPDFVG